MSERPYNEPFNVYHEVEREARREANWYDGHGYNDRDYDPASHYDAQWDEERWDRAESDEEAEARYEAMNTWMDETAYADYLADLAAVDPEEGDPF